MGGYGPVITAKIDAWSDLPGVRTAATLRRLGYAPVLDPILLPPGYEGWITPRRDGSVVLLPYAAALPHHVSCTWFENPTGDLDWNWGRCFITTQHPADRRITVEAMVLHDEPGDARRLRFEAIAERSLALLLCLDVTDEPGKDVDACLDDLRLGGATP